MPVSYHLVTSPYFFLIERRPWKSSGLDPDELSKPSPGSPPPRNRYSWQQQLEKFNTHITVVISRQLDHKNTLLHASINLHSDRLPSELLERIAGYLGHVDLACFRAVNRRLRYKTIGFDEGTKLSNLSHDEKPLGIRCIVTGPRRHHHRISHTLRQGVREAYRVHWLGNRLSVGERY